MKNALVPKRLVEQDGQETKGHLRMPRKNGREHRVHCMAVQACSNQEEAGHLSIRGSVVGFGCRVHGE